MFGHPGGNAGNAGNSDRAGSVLPRLFFGRKQTDVLCRVAAGRDRG
jgi:hypothetical protein